MFRTVSLTGLASTLRAMERDVSVLTGAAILTGATGVGLILGALVSVIVGVGAALVVLALALWLVASALSPAVTAEPTLVAVPEPATRPESPSVIERIG